MVWEVFQVSVSISDWSFTPGHVSVKFNPATATTFLRGIFSTSESDREKKYMVTIIHFHNSTAAQKISFYIFLSKIDDIRLQ